MAKQQDKDWRQFVLESMTAPATSLPAAPLATATAPAPFTAGPHIQPQFDPLELLPPAAADKLRLLRQRSVDLHAVIPAFEQIREASMAKIEGTNALKRLTDHAQDGGFDLKEGDRRVIEATKVVEKATADFKRLQELQEVRTAAWRAASQAKAACEEWLKNGVPGNCTIEAVEVEPKLNKGESILDGIERLRRRCRELRADAHRIRSAPFPSAYCKARMRAQIEQLAERGSPSVARLVELDGPVDFQTTRLTSEVHGEHRQLAFSEVPDAVALAAWLHKDALIAALDREIDAESDDKNALSHSDREVRIAETMADLLAVEREESWLVWLAQSQGLPIEHRPDVDPRALLSVALVTAARGSELPETTAGHSWPWKR